MSWLEQFRPTPNPAAGPTTPGPAAAGFEAHVITGEVNNVLRATEGARNHTLNRAAFNLAQILPADMWRPQLEAAGAATGLSPTEIARTIDSGIKGAERNPRPPERMPRGSVRPVQDLPSLDGYSDTPAGPQGIPEALDWRELWEREARDEWILEPFIAPGRQTVIYSLPKVGKSLLALQMAVAISRGAPTLGVPTTKTPVLYIDFENDPVHDVRSRLMEMGHGPEDLDGLIYLSYPSIAPMDTEAGARQMDAILDHYRPGLVIIDTISRAVSGEENSNDTWTALYRLTGLVLKRKGISLLRLDHSGKDETRGQRGGSAKMGDVDAVWRMSEVVRDNAYRLDCELKRMAIDETTIELRREHDPLAHHVATEPAGVTREKAILDLLDKAGIPRDAGRDQCAPIVRAAGIRVRNGTLAEIVRRRRGVLAEYE
jgi:hypothetical protein